MTSRLILKIYWAKTSHKHPINAPASGSLFSDLIALITLISLPWKSTNIIMTMLLHYLLSLLLNRVKTSNPALLHSQRDRNMGSLLCFYFPHQKRGVGRLCPFSKSISQWSNDKQPYIFAWFRDIFGMFSVVFKVSVWEYGYSSFLKCLTCRNISK